MIGGDLQAALEFVLVENQIHHVSEYQNLKPKDRPYAICPECKQQVIMRLGEIRMFHAAHKGDSDCKLTNPESALHLNAKYHLFQELRTGLPLYVYNRCKGVNEHGCKHRSKEKNLLFRDWDEVALEYPMGGFRSDIALLKNSIPVAIIEIYVTHAIDREKEKLLKEVSLPWIEIDASDILPDGVKKNNWSIDYPIVYKRINVGSIHEWVCDKCKKEYSDDYRLYLRKEDNDQYETKGFRIIDFYYRDQQYKRIILFSRTKVEDGRTTSHIIEDQNFNVIGEVINESNGQILQQNLKRAINNFIEHNRHQCIMVDIHMKWQRWEKDIKIENIVQSNYHAVFPQRYYWYKRKRIWKLTAIQEFRGLDWNNFFINRNEYMNNLFKVRRVQPDKWLGWDFLPKIPIRQLMGVDSNENDNIIPLTKADKKIRQ